MRNSLCLLLLVLLASCSSSFNHEEDIVAAKPILIGGKYQTVRVVYITSPSYEEYPATYAGMRVEIVSAEGNVTASMVFDTSSTDFPPSPDVLVNGNTFLLLGVPFKNYVGRYVVNGNTIEETTTATDKTVFPGKIIYDTLLMGMNAHNEQLYYCPFSGTILPEEELILRDDTSQTRTLFFLVSKETGSARSKLYYYRNSCADTTGSVGRFIGQYPGSTYGFDSAGFVGYKQQYFRTCEEANVLLGGKYLEHVFIHAQDERMVLCSERSGDVTQLAAYTSDGKVLWNYAFPDAEKGALMPGSSCTVSGNAVVIVFNTSQYMVLDKSTGTLLTSYY